MSKLKNKLARALGGWKIETTFIPSVCLFLWCKCQPWSVSSYQWDIAEHKVGKRYSQSALSSWWVLVASQTWLTLFVGPSITFLPIHNQGWPNTKQEESSAFFVGRVMPPEPRVPDKHRMPSLNFNCRETTNNFKLEIYKYYCMGHVYTKVLLFIKCKFN